MSRVVRVMSRHKFEILCFGAGFSVSVLFCISHNLFVANTGPNGIGTLLLLLFPVAVPTVGEWEFFNGGTWIWIGFQLGIYNGLLYVAIGLALRAITASFRRNRRSRTT